MGSWSVRLAHALFIVPTAHVRFDRTFQAEMYELFHLRAPARLGHLIFTPLINIALLAVLGALVPGGEIVGAAAIVAWSLYVDRIAGLLVVPLALAAVVGSHELASLLGAHVLAGGLGIAFAGGFAQAASHAPEPIPPPWTGSHRFMPLGPWLRSTPPARVAILFLLTPTVFPLLEVWAAPRVWVLQVMHLMMRAGYRRELRTQLERRVVEILDDARTGWPQPELEQRTRAAT
jgi:hypothetical protein